MSFDAPAQSAFTASTSFASATQWSPVPTPQAAFPSVNQTPQVSFEAPFQSSWPAPAETTGSPQALSAPVETRQSMLPALYQPGLPAQEEPRQTTMSLQLLPQQMVEHLLPALPETPETVHIPQFYTKERPLVPRYRAISGLLSVLIVALLACGGIGYYAKASGTLDRIGRFLNMAPPPSLSSKTPANLPDPKQDPDLGPAANIISSAATTAHYDKAHPNDYQLVNTFHVNQEFYVICNISPQNADGFVLFKWYMNNALFATTFNPSDKIPASTDSHNYYVAVKYPQPAEGSVEIYWRDQAGKDQLAQRLYFVVR